jgi:hypothetical protein
MVMPPPAAINANNKSVYVEETRRWIRFPASVTTVRQQVRYLVAKGYVWTAYLVARHSDKVLMFLLRQLAPGVPWRNIQTAARYS